MNVFLNRALRGVIVIVALIALAAALNWSWEHPFGTSWDEYGYLNHLDRDNEAVSEQGLRGAVDRIFRSDRDRPPAYRLAAFPVVEMLGDSPPVMRTLSLLGLLLSGGLVYFSARRFVGIEASLLASVFFPLSFATIWASMHFGMEYVLYPAMAMLLYAAFRVLRLQRIDRTGWWQLAVALTVGALSKTSFLLVAFPVVAVLGVLLLMRKLAVESWRQAILPIVLSALCVLPWWYVNFGDALEYAQYSSAFFRHDFPWIETAWTDLTGPYFGALLLILAGAGLLGLARFVKGERVANPPGLGYAIILCAASAVPLAATQMMGDNHNMRLLTPALVPIALLAGLLFETLSSKLKPVMAVAVAVLLGLQGYYFVSRIDHDPVDQWDWETLREACLQHGLAHPRLAHLGNGNGFNPPAIESPWVKHHDNAVHDQWLWRYEQGPIQWASVDQELAQADVVITAPQYRGDPIDKQDLDNENNSALVRRLQGAVGFAGPYVLTVGMPATALYVWFRVPTQAHR